MRKGFFIGLFIAGFTTIATAQTITFDKTIIDYGTIKKGNS